MLEILSVLSYLVASKEAFKRKVEALKTFRELKRSKLECTGSFVFSFYRTSEQGKKFKSEKGKEEETWKKGFLEGITSMIQEQGTAASELGHVRPPPLIGKTKDGIKCFSEFSKWKDLTSKPTIHDSQIREKKIPNMWT